MDKKNTPRSRIRALEKIRNKHIGNDIGTQGKRLLEAMMNESGISTLEARKHLDVLHPAGRIKELIAKGNDIKSMWVYAPTDCGILHHVKKYVYVGKISYPLFDDLDEGKPNEQ